MGTQAQIQKPQPKKNIPSANNANTLSISNLQIPIQHPNISNNVLVEQSRESNDYYISLTIKSNSAWKKKYNPNKPIASVIEDFKQEKPYDYPQLNETQLYINQTLIDPNVTLSSIVKKGILRSELTLTYNIIGVEDFVFDSDNFLKHEIHFIGKPFPNPFTVLIFSRKDKVFKAAEFTLDSIHKSDINNYSNLSAYCNGKNCLFLSGGDKGGLLSHFWEIDLITQVISKHPIGITPKKQHSMIYIPKNIVFIAGGSDKGAMCYNIKKKEMEKWADMNSEHIEPALAIIDSKYLYAFSNSKSKSVMFERTNLRSMPKWEKITPLIGNYIQFTQKFFGVCEENEESLIFLGGSMLEYDINSQIEKYCFVYNHKTNKLNESNTKFEEYNLAEKTFLPFNSRFSFMIPNAGIRDTKLLIYNKKKERIDVLKFDIPKEYNADADADMNDPLSVNREAAKSTIIPKKYLFKLPRLEEKDEIDNIMAQSQIGNQLNINQMLNAKDEPKNDSNYNLLNDNLSQTKKREGEEGEGKAFKGNNKQKGMAIIPKADNDEEKNALNHRNTNEENEIEIEIINHKDKEKDKDEIKEEEEKIKINMTQKETKEIEIINDKGKDGIVKMKQTEIQTIVTNQSEISKNSNKDSNILDNTKFIEPNTQMDAVKSNNNSSSTAKIIQKKPREKLDLKPGVQKEIATIINNKEIVPEDNKPQANPPTTEKQEIDLLPSNQSTKPRVIDLPIKETQMKQKDKKAENIIEANKQKEISDNKGSLKEKPDPKGQKELKAIDANDAKDSSKIKDQPPPKVDNSKKEANIKEAKQKNKNENQLDSKPEVLIKDNPIQKKETPATIVRSTTALTNDNTNSKTNIIQNDQERQNKFELGGKYNQEDAKQKEEHHLSISQPKVELKQSGSMVRSSLIKGFGDKKKEIELSGLPQVTKHRSPIQKRKVEISGTLNKNSLQNLQSSNPNLG